MDQSDLAIKLTFKNRLMLKILAISANLNDILDELDTILDDPYARYLLRQSADFIWPHPKLFSGSTRFNQ